MQVVTTLEIADCDPYIVCPDCKYTALGMLTIDRPADYICFIEEKTTRQRTTFCNIFELREALKQGSHEEYKFGMHKDLLWREAELQAFLGVGSCGGMTRKDIRETADSVFYKGVHVGWRGHHCPEEGFPREHLMLCYENSDHLVKQIEQYEKKYGLEGTPILVVDKHWKIRRKYLNNFCFPDENPKLEWFSTIQELEDALLNSLNLHRYEDGHWAPTQTFVDYHFKEIERKMDGLHKKRKVFGDLQEAVSKRKRT